MHNLYFYKKGFDLYLLILQCWRAGARIRAFLERARTGADKKAGLRNL